MKSKYLTTTLPYVNASPHIGHAYEFVEADALARYWRLMGHEVFFNTGTDEHGQKIAQKADEKGELRQAYVDHYAEEFKKSLKDLNLSYDAFIRTTDEHHKKAAQEIWRRCDAAGDIYKKKYSGLYCVGCESFKTESDLVDGKCPDHGKEPEHIEEENYFFKLTNYQDYLEEYLSEAGVVEPEWRRVEALNFVKQGLQDFSISREKSRLDWGIPVPNDESQVMYVWFDALTNYISTLGWPEDVEGNYKKFWEGGEPMQVAGKDQVRFQSIMWQAMLKSAGLAPTRKVVYHGFINSGGQKMSKTLGNVISPFDLIEKYGTEATRYLLLRHVHPFEDTDITWERLDEWYTANLVNGLGNFVARVMKMAEAYIDPTTIDPGLGIGYSFVNTQNPYKAKIDSFRLNDAMDYIWDEIAFGDDQIQKSQPFKLIKIDPDKAKQDIANLVARTWRIAIELQPFMPDTSKTILEAIKANKKPENLFPRLTE